MGHEGPGVPDVGVSGQRWPLATSMGGIHVLVLSLPRFFHPFCPHKLTISPSSIFILPLGGVLDFSIMRLKAEI